MSTAPQKRASVMIGAAILGVIVALVIVVATFSQESTGQIRINGRTYTSESVSLFGGAMWLNYSYRGVTFGFHLWCAVTPAAGVVCGNATESTGVSYPYSFSDGPPSPNPGWQTWVAPDGHEAVQYKEGGLVHLLVAA
jgi:hypothetical protein